MTMRTPLHTFAILLLSVVVLPPNSASAEVAVLSEKKNGAPELHVPRVAGRWLHRRLPPPVLQAQLQTPVPVLLAASAVALIPTPNR